MAELDKLAHAVSRKSFMTKVAWLVGVAIGLTIIVLLTSVLLSIRQTQLEGTPTGKKLLESAESIESCTSPDGKCFKEGQARTAGAVGQLNDQQLFSAACVLSLTRTNPDATLKDVRACVERLTVQDEKP